MMQLKTKEDLQKLIDEKIEENSELEYKEARALDRSDDKKTEIAKDVSAMANEIGGIIIYGIKESEHLPRKITPIDRNKFSKEWLEQVINSNISPRIEGLKITPISMEDVNEVIYVVEILRGDTAHQNTKDHKYYKRRNFEVLPMLDYEIRDVMNRVKHPIIELNFEIEEVGREDAVAQWGFGALSPTHDLICLKVRPYNNGSVLARFINYFIEMPKGMIHSKQNVKIVSEDIVEYYGENIVEPQGRFDPILPKLYGRSEKILLSSSFKKLLDSSFSKLDEVEIKWRVHADNAPLQQGSIMLSKINKNI